LPDLIRNPLSGISSDLDPPWMTEQMPLALVAGYDDGREPITAEQLDVVEAHLARTAGISEPERQALIAAARALIDDRTGRHS
jgi:hypothetical protein